MDKVLRIFFFIVVLTISDSATGQVSRQIKNVSIDSLVILLEENTSYRWFYTKDALTLEDKFPINVSDDNLYERALNMLNTKGYSVSSKDNMRFILRGVKISSGMFEDMLSERNNVEETNVYQDAIVDNKVVATFTNKVYEIGDKSIAKKTGSAYVKGTVRNASTGEPAAGISVFSTKSKAHASTDQYGFYTILLPVGEVELKLSDFSMEELTFNLIVYNDGELNVNMTEKVHTLLGSTITAESSRNVKRSEIGVNIVRIETIKHVPVVFGEADILKVIQTLPGVKTVGEASSGFNVRGGSTDQNLILFNDGIIYNPTHLFGLFSSFNPDIVKDIELYKSSIPAQYGGRISSVLEVNSREGNTKALTGSLGVGLLTSRAHLEGPLFSDRTSFIAAFRTTYSNWLLGLLPEDSGYRQGTTSFYDFNGSISHRINNNNSIYAYAYISDDEFNFSVDTSFSYTNNNFSVKWRSNFNHKHSMTSSIGYDKYSYNTIDDSNPFTAYKLSFDIENIFLKSMFKYILNEKHTLSYGVNVLRYDLSPGSYLPYGEESLTIPNILPKEKALESALFLGDVWNISDKLQLDIGLRYSLFNNKKTHHGPEVRLSSRYLLSGESSIKAGFNSMRQYIHMLTNSTAISPTDTWKLSDDKIMPQTGWQVAIGYYRNLSNNMYELSLESYYKRMYHYLDYKSGAVIIMNPDISDDVIETHGKAWGVEMMMKKNIGKLNGWISYTYSKTQLQQLKEEGVSAINNGRWYNAHYDKPHDVKVVANYKFTHRYSISMNLDYSTGRPVTVPIGKYYTSGGYRLYYSDRNQYRIPDYFRTDLALNIEPSHNLTHLAHFSITLGVYNVTGRKNAYSVYYESKEGKVQGYMLTIFGAPIPYININIKF